MFSPRGGAGISARDPRMESGREQEYQPLLAAEQGEASLDSQSFASQFGRRGDGQAAPQMRNPAAMEATHTMDMMRGNGDRAPMESQPEATTGPDIVQFSNMFFYVLEGDGRVSVTAMRIGNLSAPCSIQFSTEDNSAKAGLKYRQTTGRIEFNPGEEMKGVEIKILSDDSFDTNLDFQVVMSDPVGCQLGDYLKTCRVVILDDDVFPTNEYREAILTLGPEDLDSYGVRLLYAFIKFSLSRIPLVMWRSGWNLAMDQCYNINYLAAIWLNVYLVDVVLAIHRPETLSQLWVPNERLWTAVLVALGIIVPKGILSYIDFLKDGKLAVGGKVKLHLKVNLFRKYLYYNQDSHTKVSAQELTKAMEDDINELVMDGFMVMFKLAEQTVKVAVILYFLIHKRPSSALPLLIYPIAMALVLNLRYETTLILKDKLRDAEKATMICLRESCDDINLIKEYNMRTNVVGRYEKSIKDQSGPSEAYGNYDFRTMLIMPWITHVAIAAFMIVGGHFVLEGQLSLGAYLATINIYKDAGELFSGFYKHLKDCYGVIGPLLRIVRLLNLDTDVEASRQQANERTKGMLEELQAEESMRKQFALSARGTSRFDMLHIKLVHCSLANDRGGPAAPALQDISVEVPQGKLTSILGPHGSGKLSLLRLLTGLNKPTNGKIIVPSHLRTLCVPNVPEMFKNGNLLENLTFGTKGVYDKNRLLALCNGVGLGEQAMRILDKEFKEDPASENAYKKEQKGVVPWYEQLSSSELLKMHITRALNLNPEVLLFHRPVDEMEADHAARILNLLRDHVDHRGLYLTPQQQLRSRPHTVFFTSGEDRERAESAYDVADVVWHVSDKGFRVEPGGRHPAGGQQFGNNGKNPHHQQGNRVVNSWCREVRSLQVNLEKEKHLHTATMEELETHKGEIEYQRNETEQLRGQLNDVTAQAKRALRDAKFYETELANWEAQMESEHNTWLPCTDKSKGTPPAPRQLSQTLKDMIAAGEGRKGSARGPSPYGETYAVGAMGE